MQAASLSQIPEYTGAPAIARLQPLAGLVGSAMEGSSHVTAERLACYAGPLAMFCPSRVLCHEYRRSKRRCVTVREMKGSVEIGLDDVETGADPSSGIGSCVERENLGGDAKGKDAMGRRRESLHSSALI